MAYVRVGERGVKEGRKKDRKKGEKGRERDEDKRGRGRERKSEMYRQREEEGGEWREIMKGRER